MNKLMTKVRKNKKGFTLAELLVVVAIIGVLVAVSIPVFGGALAKAEHARNLANVRAEYAERLLDAMTSDGFGKDGDVEITIDVGHLANVIPKNCTITCKNGDSITVSTAGKYTGSFEVDNDVKFTTNSSVAGNK